MAKQRQVSGKVLLELISDDRETAEALERFVALAESRGYEPLEGPRDIRWVEMAVGQYAREYGEDLLRELVLDRLRRPHVCTLADLNHALLGFMLEHGDGGAAYNVFKAGLHASTAYFRRSAPFTIFTGKLPEGCAIDTVLWKGVSAFSIAVVGVTEEQYEEYASVRDGEPEPNCPGWRGVPDRTIFAAVEGQCSLNALSALVTEVQPVLTSLFTTVWALLGDCDFHVRARLSQKLLDEDGTPHNFWLIPACLEAYFAEPTTKDSIDRRIRNAVALLSEADRQASHAVGLALAVAAMEALVGRKGEGIVSSIADNVAALLEPDLDRRADAVEFSKRIYDLRSRVMHGEAIEGERAVLGQARLLASGLLKAMLERRATMRRLGEEPETPEDLLKEMKRGRFAAGLPGGVTESIARTLWGAPTDNAP